MAEWMDGWMDGWRGGWTDVGWTDRRMDGWVAGLMDPIFPGFGPSHGPPSVQRPKTRKNGKTRKNNTQLGQIQNAGSLMLFFVFRWKYWFSSISCIFPNFSMFFFNSHCSNRTMGTFLRVFGPLGKRRAVGRPKTRKNRKTKENNKQNLEKCKKWWESNENLYFARNTNRSTRLPAFFAFS